MAEREADMAGLDAATVKSIQNWGGISSGAAAASASVEKAAESSVTAAASIETVGAASAAASTEVNALAETTKVAGDEFAVYGDHVGRWGESFAIPAQSAAEATVAIEGMGASMGPVADAGAAVEASVNKAATSTVLMGETAEAASARIKAMIAASLDQVSANGIVGESERSLAERAAQRAMSTEAQIAATAALTDAGYTQAEMNARGAAILETENRVRLAAIASTEAETVVVNANTVAKGMNSRTAYSLSALLSDAASG